MALINNSSGCFLAALSSSRSLVVCLSIRWSANVCETSRVSRKAGLNTSFDFHWVNFFLLKKNHKNCVTKKHVTENCDKKLRQIKFCHTLSFWVFLQFWYWHNLSFITIWVFEFCNNLGLWVLSQFGFLRLVTFWVFEFGNNLSFWVLSQFEFFASCHDLSFF